ncbi:MAG: CBS domain-containing protein [Longimicrobiaceae bacterium]
MARYPRDYQPYDRDFRGGPPRRRRYGYDSGYGGMRSDARPRSWRDFPGEGGWYGERPGYPDRELAAQGSRFRERDGGYEPRGPRYGPPFAGHSRGALPDADRVRAAEIMTRDPETVTPDAMVADVARKMRQLNVGIIPVVDGDDTTQLRGVVTDRDLAVRVLAEGGDGTVKVSECMSEEVATVDRFDTVHDIFNVMKRERVRRVPVTDGQGRLVGIVAQADLAVNYAGLDLQRETEVEEVLERISEPAAPRRGEEYEEFAGSGAGRSE